MAAGSDVEDLDEGDNFSAEAMRRQLERAPKPTVATHYNVAEADFWRHRHIPIGSVLTFPFTSEIGEEMGTVAVRVAEVESFEHGMWLGVLMVGSESKEHRARLQAIFRNRRTPIHICYDVHGMCTQLEEGGLHLREFTWHPHGEFDAPWLTTHGARVVKEALTPAPAGKKRQPALRKSDGAEPKHKGRSETEQRLARLRGDGLGAVSFAGDAPPRKRPRERGTGSGAVQDGDARERRPSSPVPARSPSTAMVKVETVDLTKRSPKERRGKDKTKVGDALMAAATTHQQNVKKEKKRDRSRSKKRGKRRRRSRRRSDSRSSSGSDDREASCSSSSSSLMPPLKRRSKKEPGSVLRLLEQQAFEYLSQDGLLEEEDYSAELGRNRPRLTTYFQIALRPKLDPKARDCRELALLARALDLLREGKLDELADILSARLIAIDTAQRQGWGTAQFLEIHTGEEQGTVPPHILLAAQKHGKQVEKAGGKGSWPRSSGWSQEWPAEAGFNPKGKGTKGKGKKGKGKAKGGKGKWQGWADKEKEAKGTDAPAT